MDKIEAVQLAKSLVMEQLSIAQNVTINKFTSSKHLHKWAIRSGLLHHPTVLSKLQDLRTPVSFLKFIVDVWITLKVLD